MNTSIFNWKQVLIPISIQQAKVYVDSISYHGYMVIRIFGIRIIQIQLTQPW